MLSAISVRNIVLIDQLDLALDGGLSALTGETGAGKSILLDALTLALGGRGDAALVRKGTESGQVVAVLQLPESHPARVALRENDISDDAELILRRVQFADGRTRAFINDQPVGAGLLQNIGRLLVEIHGQHDDRALVDAATHRALLDVFGGLDCDAAIVQSAHSKLIAADDAVARQRAVIAEAQSREEFARHAVQELSELAPEEGEEDLLAERRQRLMQLEKAAEEVRDADEILGGPMAPGPALSGL
ncbi:MAG: AAA family ATPase, partial [Devosia sp.]